MSPFSMVFPLLLYSVLIILGVVVALYFISFLRVATRYLELKIREIESRQDDPPK